MIRRLSVRWRITLVAAGLFAVALGLASFVLVREVRSNLVSSIRSTDQQQLEALASQIGNNNEVPSHFDFAGQPPRGTQFVLQTPAGRMLCSQPGTGCDPRTLSTAIFSGTGVRRVSGAASMLTMKIAPICRR